MSLLSSFNATTEEEDVYSRASFLACLQGKGITQLPTPKFGLGCCQGRAENDAIPGNAKTTLVLFCFF